MEIAMDLRDIEVKITGEAIVAIRLRSAAYIGITVLLSLFIVSFATAPKARTHFIEPVMGSLDRIGPQQSASLPRRT